MYEFFHTPRFTAPHTAKISPFSTAFPVNKKNAPKSLLEHHCSGYHIIEIVFVFYKITQKHLKCKPYFKNFSFHFKVFSFRALCVRKMTGHASWFHAPHCTMSARLWSTAFSRRPFFENVNIKCERIFDFFQFSIMHKKYPFSCALFAHSLLYYQ